MSPPQDNPPPAKQADALEGLRCPKCDYELTGLPTAQCPECGTKVVPAELRISSLQKDDDRALLGRSARWTLWMTATLLIIQFSIRGFLAIKPPDYELPYSLEFTLVFLMFPLVIVGQPILALFALVEVIWSHRVRERKSRNISLLALIIAIASILFSMKDFAYV